MDGWNLFDFFVIVGSIIGLIISFYTNIDAGTSSTVIRSLRIARLFKMYRTQKSL